MTKTPIYGLDLIEEFLDKELDGKELCEFIGKDMQNYVDKFYIEVRFIHKAVFTSETGENIHFEKHEKNLYKREREGKSKKQDRTR